MAADCSTLRTIAYHIDKARPGDEVLIAISSWWDIVGWPITVAVTRAKERNVDVRVIADGGRPPASWHGTQDWTRQQLMSKLGSDFHIWNGTGFQLGMFPKISHNKFVLIHRKSEDMHIVVISGANWAPFDVSRHCDVLAVDNKMIWGAFRNFWVGGLLASSNGGSSLVYESDTIDMQAGVSAHLWPRLVLEKPDPMVDASKHPLVRAMQLFKKAPSTSIRIIAAFWNDSAVIDTLVKYKQAGADVRVVGNHHLDKGCHNVPGCPLSPGGSPSVGSCETQDSIWIKLSTNGIPWAKSSPHAKVLIISGMLESGGGWRRSVYTGSLNMTLAYDMPDAVIGIHDDPVIFEQYMSWWDWLCANASMKRSGIHVCGAMVKNA